MNRLASPAQLRASVLRWALFLVPAVMLLGFAGVAGQVFLLRRSYLQL